MARRTPRMGATPVVWWARRSRRPRCACRCSSRHRWTCRYSASARTTALSRCCSGDDVIATAVPAAVQAQAPPAPTVEEAEIATRRYVGFAHHRFPTCFVCGTARDDGLRIYAGRVGDSPLIASPWTPESDDPLFAWAVLDCPSAYAIESVDHRAQIVVLASLTVELRERPRAGERHVVAAWPVAATAGSTTRLLRSTTRRDASSPSPTHSGSSCETPPRSAAERATPPIVLSLVSRLCSPDHGLDQQVKRGGEETCLLCLLGELAPGPRRLRRWRAPRVGLPWSGSPRPARRETRLVGPRRRAR